MDAATISSRNAANGPDKPAGSQTAPPKRVNGKMRRRMLTMSCLDGRTAASKRAAHLIRAISLDITGGDLDLLTEGKKQLVQRAALLGTLIENDEVAWLAGDAVDLQTYFAAINSQRRILETLGLDRRPRNVTPLDDILARMDREEAAAAITITEAAE